MAKSALTREEVGDCMCHVCVVFVVLSEEPFVTFADDRRFVVECAGVSYLYHTCDVAHYQCFPAFAALKSRTRQPAP